MCPFEAFFLRMSEETSRPGISINKNKEDIVKHLKKNYTQKDLLGVWTYQNADKLLPKYECENSSLIIAVGTMYGHHEY